MPFCSWLFLNQNLVAFFLTYVLVSYRLKTEDFDYSFETIQDFFLWGMLEFILNQQSEEAKTTGKSHMVWGVVGIAIMLGVWTILNIVLNTLNIPKSEIDPEAGEVHLGP